jgi:hypothetical protein
MFHFPDSDKLPDKVGPLLMFTTSLGVPQATVLQGPPESVGILAEELCQVGLHLGEVHQRPLQALQLLARVLKYHIYVI